MRNDQTVLRMQKIRVRVWVRGKKIERRTRWQPWRSREKSIDNSCRRLRYMLSSTVNMQESNGYGHFSQEL